MSVATNHFFATVADIWFAGEAAETNRAVLRNSIMVLIQAIRVTKDTDSLRQLRAVTKEND
ncbi:MAG: hypothetical protein DMG50_22530 [Acidobacteria bacterium]|nr:MAG: hypothetical protein DMG50_22530 [Acidobacteriota bacterium]